MTQPHLSSSSLQAPCPVPRSVHVSLLAFPDAVVSTLAGIFDVMNLVALLGTVPKGLPAGFDIEIVGEVLGPVDLASGMPINVQRAISTIETSDIVIVPSVLLQQTGWEKGRYPGLVEWLQRMHERGAIICSACSGVFLLGETGLFDGRDATVHFGYAREFQAAYPVITVHPERVLVISGVREELVSSGASMSWHDLVLYLIARFLGAAVAQQIARQFALQWHQDGLTPYIVFEGRADHGDAEIQSAQRWLSEHFSVANPVEEMIKQSRLAERTFKRHFIQATGLAPMVYVQRLRIEDAKRRLERTDASTEEISWRVGYEDAAFFRRLFKRNTGLTPAAYRKRFRMPDFSGS